MRLVLSISEKAARALRVLAAEQGLRGVSALVELVYGGDPPVMVHRSSDLAQLLEKIAAQEPGDIEWVPDPGPLLIDSERAKELEQVMKARGLEELKYSRDKAFAQEEGTLGDGHE